jgi:hypothetical protein
MLQKALNFFETIILFEFFLKYTRKMVGAGDGAIIFDKLELDPEQHKNGAVPQQFLKPKSLTEDFFLALG